VEVTSTVTNNGIYTVICKGNGTTTGRYTVSTLLIGGHTPDDIDGDGVNNADELNAWTDPFSAASVFRITNIVLMPATNRPAFSWQTVGSMRYRVQYSGNLSPAIFTDIVRSQAQETESDVPEGLPHWQDFTDTFAPPQGSPTNGVRFYRVRIVR
jgi:hypothetical protein